MAKPDQRDAPANPETQDGPDGYSAAGLSPFQYSLRTMLLVMTGFAVLFSMLKTFGVGGLCLRICAIGFFASPIVWPLLWYRRACKRHGIW